MKRRAIQKLLGIALSCTMLCGVTAGSFVTLTACSGRQESGMQYIYPEKIAGNLHNPGMGWDGTDEVTWCGMQDLGWSGVMPEVDGITLSGSWAQIETEEDVYDFSVLERTVDYWSGQGKHITLRISTDSLVLPHVYNGVPDYIFDKYNVGYEWMRYDGISGITQYKAVDIRDAKYLERLDKFLAKLCEFAESKESVVLIDLLGYGSWGEWHSGHSFDDYEDRVASLKNIIDRYCEAFKNCGKSLVISSSWEYREDMTPNSVYSTYEEYIQWSAFDYAMKQENVSFFRWGGAGVLKYDSDERLASDYIRSNKKLPLTGEFFSAASDLFTGAQGFTGVEGIDDIAFKLRVNYSTIPGWYNKVAATELLEQEGGDEIIARGNQILGYRLAVDRAQFPKKVAPGGEMTLLTAFSNTAVGRFQYKYPLKVYFLDGNGQEVFSYVNVDSDFRNLLYGDVYNVYSSFEIPENLSEGIYQIAVAIVDEQGNPAIRLGMAGDDGNKRYILGDIEVEKNTQKKDFVFCGSWEQAQNYRFDPDSTYQITLEYTPQFSLQDFKFGSYNGYEFYLQSETGGESSVAGYAKWQDVSGEKGYRTFVVQTKNYKDYHVVLNTDDYAPILTGKVWIEKTSGALETFENYDLDSISGSWYNYRSNSAMLTSEKTQVLSGKDSILLQATGKGDKDCLVSDPRNLKLKPKTSYTVSFLFKADTPTGNGGYMYLSLGSGSDSERIGEWYERADTPAMRKTYTFVTGDETDQFLAFGMKNNGSYIIDDLILIENASGKVIEGSDIAYVQNEKPDIGIGFGDTEGFENGTFGGSAYNEGFFNFGRMTDKEGEVINGKYSLLGFVDRHVTQSDWFLFSKSRFENLRFEPNSVYKVKLSYKILEEAPTKIINGIEQKGYYFLLIRSDKYEEEGRYDQDVSFRLEGEVGQVYTKEFEFMTPDRDDTRLIFAMFLTGKIAIDDVTVTKLPAVGAWTGNLDFENGSTLLSHLSPTYSGIAEIVSDQQYVIDGKYSLLCENKTGAEWYDFFSVNRQSFVFEPNKTYTVSFDYKIIDPPEDGVGFQCYAKNVEDDNDVFLGDGTNTSLIRFNGEAGQTGTIKYTVEFDNKTYYFGMGMQKQGAVVIDNLKIVCEN